MDTVLPVLFKGFYVKKLFSLLTIIFSCNLFAVNGFASSNYFVRNYPFGITLPESAIELSADYLGMSDAIDIFDFQESRSSSVSETYRSDTLGKYDGIRLIANYGISDDLLLNAEYNYRNLNITFGNYQISNFNSSIIKNFDFSRKIGSFMDYFFIGGGLDFNIADDYHATDIDEINYMAQRIDSSVTVYSTPGRINISNGSLTYSSSIVDSNGNFKDPLTVSVVDSKDSSFFLKWGAGKQFKYIHVSLFAEIGYTTIEGRLDNNLDLYGLDDSISQIRQLKKSLDRDETYKKTGINLYHKSNLGFVANMAYYYLSVDRESNLDYVDYNHVVEAIISIDLGSNVAGMDLAISNLALNIGGEYYYRQFAGVVPFLYNEQSQTAFDHDYGVVTIGLSARL